MSKEQPTKWVLGWSGDIEIGFDDGTFLPRKAALILYPEYFDEEGNPIKEKLPFAKPKTENKKNVFAEFIAKYLTVKDIKRIDQKQIRVEAIKDCAELLKAAAEEQESFYKTDRSKTQAAFAAGLRHAVELIKIKQERENETPKNDFKKS